jgi:hypothetical protein
MPEINQLKKVKVLFWLTVIEVLFHDWLATLLWACGKAKHHGREYMVKQDVHLITARKQMRYRKVWIPNTPFRDIPSMTYELPLVPSS